MGTAILRGISSSLLVTVITLLAGMFWNAMGFGGLSASNLVDIGLLASCIVGGYRAGKEGGSWISGGITGIGFVTVGILLLALFLPVQVTGALQVLAEGALISAVAGVFGTQIPGSSRKRSAWSYSPSPRRETNYYKSNKTEYIEDYDNVQIDEEEEWEDINTNSKILTFPSEGKRWNKRQDRGAIEYEDYKEQEKEGEDDLDFVDRVNCKDSRTVKKWWEEELSQR